MRYRLSYYQPVLLFILSIPFAALAQRSDTSVLRKVTLISMKPKNSFSSVIPAQSLNRDLLEQLNVPSLGDAARYFSGVLVKDYGGVGGLKTVSVRSLGASQTGVVYDGVPVSDLQAGQIDLGRYPTTFIHSLEIHQAHPDDLLQPARVYASASVLSVRTRSFYSGIFRKKALAMGLHTGSFGLWQPHAGISIPVSPGIVLGINTEAVFSKGDYPFIIANGNLSEKSKRQNSTVRSFVGELNMSVAFADSAVLLIKGGGTGSERGLPGAIVFFNDRSVQHLQNDDYFIQARYNRKLDRHTRLLLSGKFNYSYTKYTDPDYLNNQGGLDNRYRQREYYASACAQRRLGRRLSLAVASDISLSALSSNLSSFANPGRLTLWHNIAAEYSRAALRLSASLLWTYLNDRTEIHESAGDIGKLTPTIALGLRPSVGSPFLFRVFYKHVFRVPTFNDLYYNFIGNIHLAPEYARQYNAGFSFAKETKGKVTSISLSADAYYNTIKDKIVAVPNKNLYVWTMLNLGRVSITGIDISSELEGVVGAWAKWAARIAYTWQRAIDITDPRAATFKDRIPYTPDHSGSGFLSIQRRNWSAGYSLLFSGTRYTLGDNNPFNQLDGWATQDVFVSKVFQSGPLKAGIKAEISNIANTRYDVVRYYPMPGRSFKITLSLNNL